MGKTLLKDSDWATVDGQLCLVTAFTPMATVEDGQVVAVGTGRPYAAVSLRCGDFPDDITGFISHKIDFAMLWAAFYLRSAVPGTRVDFRASDRQTTSPLHEDEEVWLVWTRRNYRGMAARVFSRFLPRLIVMVCRKDAFELATSNARPELTGQARAMAALPLITWTPDVMNL